MSEFTDGTTKFVVTQSLGVLPGTVTAFSGTFEDGYPINKNTGLVDKEWHLCDGTNGTPDLRNRFIYGGDGANNGATGGEASHKLTEAELPTFTPTVRVSTLGGDYSGDMRHDSTSTLAAGAGRGSSHNESVISNPFNTIGGNQPHNNMPPYYVMAYIMKM